MDASKIKSALADISAEQDPTRKNLSQCEQLVKEVADELEIKSPLHPDLTVRSVGKTG
jgi:hypothetical protein